MKNERNVTTQENGQEVKHRYRLNKRKFTVALALFCFMIAALIIAVHFISSYEQKVVIAAIDLPQPTAPESSPTVSSINPERPLEGKIIVIDAGHGGEDPGASGINGTIESELNLKVALLLEEQLEDKGAAVIMTRSDERALAVTKEEDMAARREIILESSADIVISIHMNSFKDSSVSGPVVLFIAGSVQGKKLADRIEQDLNEELKPELYGTARSENLYILNSGNQPSALVECGYISNPQEEEKLNTEDYQLQVAMAICDGVIKYFTS